MQTETFYTEGPPELEAFRRRVAVESMKRAGARVAAQRARKDADFAEMDNRQEQGSRMLRALAQDSSQVAADRPISSVLFTPDGTEVVAASWGGHVKVFSTDTFANKLTIKAHDDRITGDCGLSTTPSCDPCPSSLFLPLFAFCVPCALSLLLFAFLNSRRPRAAPVRCHCRCFDPAGMAVHPSPSVSPSAPRFLTGCADGTARVFSSSGALLHTLEGHTDRLGRVAIHPGGQAAATASYDRTWRLWDVERGACLCEQEGHSRAVYAVAFQGDGSLVASAGMDCAPRVWDVRTGRCVVVLEGHVHPVLALDFSPNGYQLVSGSHDHSARVWDLRRQQCLATLVSVGAVRAQRCG